MRKILTAAVAVATLGGAIAATAPAEARPYGYGGYGNYYGGRYYGHHHHGNDAAVAVTAGVVGLALGAALANNSGYGGSYYNRGYSRPYYGGGYYSQPYYGGGYGYYEGGYATCTSRQLVWDPYIRRRVEVVNRYAC